MLTSMRSSLCKVVKFNPKIVAVRSSSSNKETYSEKQDKLNRPISPHVDIYKFPPTALSSITNRVTGVALTVGISGIGAMALAGADVSAFMNCIGNSGVGNVAKFAVAFPFAYHYLGGIRHMYWDRTPESLTNEEVEKSSYILLASSLVISGGLAFVSC